MRDSKITFRVSDDLLDEVDAINESRSEVMRDALRHYLDSRSRSRSGSPEDSARKTRESSAGHTDTIDGLITQRIEEVVENVVDDRLDRMDDQNVNVTVNMPADERRVTRGGQTQPAEEGQESRQTPAPQAPVEPEGDERKTCAQCGEEVEDGHMYCPNCGAKATQRLFCECGDEIRSDWSFCPRCGRRTPSGHALQK
ncbi:MAG: zinc-ribbon domain-containing protein [Halobacteria archaeon]|nr:zinc-ribbon domain-containing protein [Halobacteria archaeon]